MFEFISRHDQKRRARAVLRDAAVPARAMTALYLGLLVVLDLLDSFSGEGIVGTFVEIFTSLLAAVLAAGFVMYCMAIRRGERAEYLTLFDGFSFVGKIVCLRIAEYFFVMLWSMLFIIPGIVAAYRYSFAEFDLYENPGIGVMEAIEMSKKQTYGYKFQLLVLDLSYLGWTLLASLPTLILSAMAWQRYVEMLGSMTPGTIPEFFFDPAAVTGLGLPPWGWVLIQSLWGMAVMMLYLPERVCVQLAYFEIAERTSCIPGGGNMPLLYEDDFREDEDDDPDGF